MGFHVGGRLQPGPSPGLLWLPAGTSVLQVLASDADDPTYGSSARVAYSVLEGEQHFSVDSKTGKGPRAPGGKAGRASGTIARWGVYVCGSDPWPALRPGPLRSRQAASGSENPLEQSPPHNLFHGGLRVGGNGAASRLLSFSELAA